MSNIQDEEAMLENPEAYQAVTIVQSDANPGEVSYVLIMQEPDDDDKVKDADAEIEGIEAETNL